MKIWILKIFYVAFLIYFGYVTYYEYTEIMLILLAAGAFLGVILFTKAYKNKHFGKVVITFITCGAITSGIYLPSSTGIYVVGDRTTLHKIVIRNIFTEPPAIHIATYFSNDDFFVNATTKDGDVVSVFIDLQYTIDTNETEYLALASRYGRKTHSFHIKYMIEKGVAEGFINHAKTISLEELRTDNAQSNFIISSHSSIQEAVRQLDITFTGRSRIENLFI